jgi:hypothetical protein
MRSSTLLIAASACLTLVIALQPRAACAEESELKRVVIPAPVSYWYRIPRRVIVLTQAAYNGSAERLQLLSTTTSLERLRECEAHNGFSLMTLWQGERSNLSLQAGRFGEPTLRWSSRSMHRPARHTDPQQSGSHAHAKLFSETLTGFSAGLRL